MVVEQVDLVDVKDVSVGFRQDARLEPLRARPQRSLDVDRADHPVLGCVDRQLHHAHPALVGGQHAGRLKAPAAVDAQGLAVGRIAAEMAALDHIVLGQQPGQGPDSRGFARPLLAPDQHAADRRDDGIEDQGELHRLLADDRREGVAVPVEGDAH